MFQLRLIIGQCFCDNRDHIFLSEMGDKTQIATALLAAQFQTLIPVIVGTTIGMLIADVPVVLLSHRATQMIPIKIIRIISASLFFY